jgi:hypothetical protein
MANIEEKLKRIQKLADDLQAGKLKDADKQALVEALRKIADGENPSQALDVQASRGERRSKASIDSKRNKALLRQHAMAWIAAATASEEDGGLGLTLDQAIDLLGRLRSNPFGVSPDTLRKYWNNSPDLRKLEFIMFRED